ncbi:Nucleoporin p58/p45 [Phlyctochytrium planicorne]|nr:Nucleoporin p58/p45 [Phlyctochytrium planicorne]
MFGSTLGATQPQQQQAQPQQQPLGFGAATPAAPTTGATGGFSFGSTPAFGGNQTAPATGLNIGGKGLNFGQPTAQAQQTNPKTPAFSFGGNTAATTPAQQKPAGLSFGTPAAAQGAPAANNASSDGFTKTARYGEIPDHIRTQIDYIEKFIDSQKEAVEEIRSTTTRHEIIEIHIACEKVNLKYQGLKNLLDRDIALIQNLRSTMASEMKNADSAARFIDRYNNPHQSNQTHLMDVSQTYFANITNELESRLQIYRQTIDDLERHFHTLTQKPHYTPQAIADILRTQHESFISIAGKVAKVHDSISNEKDRYLNYRNKYFGDSRNPFKDPSASKSTDTPLSAIAADLVPSAPPAQQQGQQQSTFNSSFFGK